MIHIQFFHDKELSGITPKQLQGLISIVQKVWDPDLTQKAYFEKRAKQFEMNPYASKYGWPVAILMDDQKVVGHDTAVPCGIWVNGEEIPAFYRAGLHLIPEYRGRKLGSLLPLKMSEVLETKIAFFVLPQQYKIHKKLHWHLPGKLPEFVKIINPSTFMANFDSKKIKQMPDWTHRFFSHKNTVASFVTKSFFNGFVKCHRALCRPFRKECEDQFECAWVENFDEQVDNLWDLCKTFLKCAQIRSAAYLNWHFPANKGWRKLVIMENGKLRAYAIVCDKKFEGTHRLSGLRVTTLIDIFYDFNDSKTLQALLTYAEKDAMKKNSDMMLASATLKDAQKLLSINAYLPFPKTVQFTCHTNNKNIQIASTMDQWYLTRGDADAAGALGPS
jgi:hypothetical protein